MSKLHLSTPACYDTVLAIPVMIQMPWPTEQIDPPASEAGLAVLATTNPMHYCLYSFGISMSILYLYNITENAD